VTATRVLVVDDAASVRHLLRVALTGVGHPEIDEASDGAEALRLLASKAYDLCLLDLNMPVLDGWKVLAWIGARSTPPPKVIVISTMADPDTVKRAFDLGANGVLSKPLQLGMVRREVRATLGTAELEADLVVSLDGAGRASSEVPPPPDDED
jgi:CheY-like chemotaxis protein